jgi:hypothetical protein
MVSDHCPWVARSVPRRRMMLVVVQVDLVEKCLQVWLSRVLRLL